MLKKVMAIINIMLLIISGSASLAYAQTYPGMGQGTIEAPYIIENAEQLQGIRNNLTAHYRLGSDIDLENQHWQPVGENNNAFKGSLDGDGHKIKNLSIKNQSYAGLFAYGDGAVLKNITIENVNISEGKMTYAGGLIGYIKNGQVEDCAVEGSIVIKSDSSSGTSYVGGMIGHSYSSMVKNNQVNGDLSIETYSNSAIRVGGMIGEQRGSIEGCEVKGKAYINSSSQYVGGLVGYNSSGAVINSQVTAAGLIKGKNNVGGIVGYGSNGIEGSSSSIDVEGENIVGGLAGYFSGTITRSFVTGKVVSDAGKAGGLIGDTSGSVTTITQSYAAGNIESNGLTSQYTGGIVGHSSKTVNIENSFALGNITGNNYVGGLVGQVGIDSTLKTSYTVGEVKGNLNVGVLSGGSLSSSNITSCYNASQKELLIKKVNGFDYENIWDIEEGATYSYLREVDKPEQVKIGKEQYEGAGTEADPYIIENKEQLLGVKNNPGKHFAMINDIDIEMAAIEPLTGTVPFGGSFDGRDHVIKNVSVNGTGNVGLFGSCNNAVIKNLRVENIDVRGGSCIGSLIGEMEGGRVENCHISSGIVSGSTAGGLVGSNKGGDIADSSAAAEVYGAHYAGGLIGTNNLGGEISGSKAQGIVNSGSSYYAGGLIGYIGSNASKESRISNSYASGTVGKSSGRYAGGLVGSVAGAGSTVIESSYADCEIGSSSCTQAGGLIGYNSSTGALAVENSFASGVILASSYAGGIIGYSATSGSREITNSYSLCQLSGNGSKNGIAPSTVSMVSSYFDLDKAGVSTPVEQAKTSSQLKTEATYVNWDFINTWGIEAGSYPYLIGVEGISQPIYLVAPIQLTTEYITPVSVKLTWNNQATAEAYEVSYNDKIAASDTAEIVINEL